MKRSRLRLVVTGLAFAAWIGYLVYLTRQVEHIVLSHPQFQYARYVVIGRIENKNGPVTVDEVYFGDKNAPPAGAKIAVGNLRDSLHQWLTEGEWEVPGEFIIPLQDVEVKDGKWSAEVVPLPPSPGLPTGTRIYPKTPGTMEQLKAIPIGK